MKFAHLADAHLGGWREPKLRDANTQSFNACIDTCITEKVDFVIIAGDLFNTSMPGIDSLRVAVQKLKDLQNAKIPTYYIAGSHDSSPSGKTMLDVLEDAGLCINLVRGTVVDGLLNLSFTTDPKTGVKLTGILGKKGGLDKHYYTDLAREPLEKETGTKIFVFHCALNELKPKELADMDAMSVSLFPKGFAYYAGGHVHVVDKGMLGTHDNIIYPGPVFPNNFAELEKLKHGTFVIYEDGAITHRKLSIYPVISLRIDATGKSPLDVE
ncbi:MAG: exonuclease SbcCD subunit D, partial [Nanoarchaeota archaeon]